MIEKKRKKENSRGFVLPLVAVLILILTLVGIGLLKLGMYARFRSIKSTDDISARTAADSGLVQAIYLLNKKKYDETVWNNDVLPAMTGVALPNSSETFSFEVTGSPSSFDIVSTGESGNAQRKVYATTRLRSIFNFAVAVEEDLVLYPNASIDGYNSATGETGIPVQLGTNDIDGDSVIIMNGSSVNGDVFVGVDGDPEEVVENRGTITGETYPMPEEVYYPPVSPPTGLADMGFIKNSTTVVPADSGTYSYIALGNLEVLTVDGGDVVMHITDDVEIKNGGEIDIKAGSSLKVYIDGDWISKEGATVTNENDFAKNFSLYGTGEPGQIIELKAKNEFYGVVYAPDASVGIKAGGDIFGSFVSAEFELKSKSNIYYDTELSEVDVDDVDAYFAVNSWREE